MAKYDTVHRKTERNRQLIEYRRQHPELAFQEIADVFNISVQRAWKIIKDAEKKDMDKNEIKI